MDNELLYQTIFNRLLQEDKELSILTGKGIFYAPELYIAIIIGKEIKKNDKEIFGEESKWIRETDLGNGGPSDFVFMTKNNTYVFELKLRDTIHAYSSDVVKLKKLGTGFTKLFLALVDSWQTDQENDERIVALENKHQDLNRASNFVSFPTNQDRYKGQICCTVGLWEITN